MGPYAPATMKDVTDRERWDVWLVQAQRFARRENYIDALGRVRMILSGVDAALTTVADDDDRTKLLRFRHRIEKRTSAIQKQFDEWNAKIAARRALSIANAEAEMERALPLGPDERI